MLLYGGRKSMQQQDNVPIAELLLGDLATLKKYTTTKLCETMHADILTQRARS